MKANAVSNYLFSLAVQNYVLFYGFLADFDIVHSSRHHIALCDHTYQMFLTYVRLCK